jgi:hypothetical protein
MDIDPLAVSMCKVNGALYAPWMAFPLPASILGKSAEPPMPESSPEGLRIYHVNQHGQGLMFDL